MADSHGLVKHGLEERIGGHAIVAIDAADDRLRVEHTERAVEGLQAQKDAIVQVFATLVADVVVGTKDVALVVKILFLRGIRQQQQQ